MTRGRKPEGGMALSNAERQARWRVRHQSLEPPGHLPHGSKLYPIRSATRRPPRRSRPSLILTSMRSR
jgi:hypothetical protein